MSIIIKKNGFLATIQDLGRTGFRRAGINPNGAMDKRSVRLLNILLENDENAAVLEMHFPAPVLEFKKNALIAIGGADFDVRINKRPIENWRPIFIEKDQQLGFSKKKSGNRVYLAIKGGFLIAKWLRSTSTNLSAGIGGFNGRSLQMGDKLDLNQPSIGKSENFNFLISNRLIPKHQTSPKTIRLIAGAELKNLTGLSEENLFKNEFTISNNSDRMGFRLTGEPLFLLDNFDLISSAVDFGTIQILPDGQLIILMADHQTAGGYPRIGHVISADLPILAQLGAYDKIRFEPVSIEEAENLIVQNEFDLSYLKFAVHEKQVQKNKK